MLGKKISQSQLFTDRGSRQVITFIKTGPCFVTQIKSEDTDGYWGVQLGFDQVKPTNRPKPLKGIFKKAGLKTTPRFLREFELSEVGSWKSEVESKENLKLGQKITVDEVFKVGDKVRVIGVSKGKGFAGVVKRWGFKGGPRTHGQSDRERAPGSIGQTTTPGRVFKGKKMAGRMGSRRITISGLKILKVDDEKDLLIVSGLVPGAKGGLLAIHRLE